MGSSEVSGPLRFGKLYFLSSQFWHYNHICKIILIQNLLKMFFTILNFPVYG